jgi:hypothetical protein
LLNNQIVLGVRIFDIYAAVLVVSNEPTRYLETPNDPKLRFVTIDSVNGEMRNTSFAEEQHRLTLAMMASRTDAAFS